MINIYIDESGSFVPADYIGAWNLSAALVVPNLENRKCRESLRRLKIKSGFRYTDEIKLKNVNEADYQTFLKELSKTNSTLYCVATDTGMQSFDEIANHRNAQADKVEEHKNKMIHPEGRKAVENLANQVRQLSPQLHIQLICQVELIADLVEQSILYYVQRIPSQLNGFRWRIDEKLSGESNFEKTFRTIVPPILQSKSLENPSIHVIEFDYSAMKEFFYTKENMPTYLKETYGIDTNEDGGLNLNKLVWKDFEFVDSKKELGVQIVDLLASGLRRCLRGGFNENSEIAKGLGRLMVQAVDGRFPIRFITISDTEITADNAAAKVSRIFKRTQRKMIL